MATLAFTQVNTLSVGANTGYTRGGGGGEGVEHSHLYQLLEICYTKLLSFQLIEIGMIVYDHL